MDGHHGLMTPMTSRSTPWAISAVDGPVTSSTYRSPRRREATHHWVSPHQNTASPTATTSRDVVVFMLENADHGRAAQRPCWRIRISPGSSKLIDGSEVVIEHHGVSLQLRNGCGVQQFTIDGIDSQHG